MNTHEKIHEIKEGPVVVEVFEKRVDLPDIGPRIYYDISLCREFTARESGEIKRGPLVQQRDLDDVIIAVVRAKKVIDARYYENRRSSSKKIDIEEEDYEDASDADFAE